MSFSKTVTHSAMVARTSGGALSSRSRALSCMPLLVCLLLTSYDRADATPVFGASPSSFSVTRFSTETNPSTLTLQLSNTGAAAYTVTAVSVIAGTPNTESVWLSVAGDTSAAVPVTVAPGGSALLNFTVQLDASLANAVPVGTFTRAIRLQHTASNVASPFDTTVTLRVAAGVAIFAPLSINEGVNSTAMVRLRSRFLDNNVFVRIAGVVQDLLGGGTDPILSNTYLNFTSANWNTSQPVYIFAPFDDRFSSVRTLNLTYTTSTSTETSGNYAALATDIGASVDIIDTNSSGFRINGTLLDSSSNYSFSLAVTEGQTAPFIVTLASATTSFVQLNFPSNVDVRFTPSFVVLGVGNWSTGALVFVEGIQDTIIEGYETFNMTVAPSQIISPDPAFGPSFAFINHITVTVTDDDVVMASISPVLGPKAGGTKITLSFATGVTLASETNPTTFPTVQCYFPDANAPLPTSDLSRPPVDAVVISSTTVTCTPTQCQQVVVNVGSNSELQCVTPLSEMVVIVNGQTSSNTQSFFFYESFSITSADPSGADVRETQLVTVTGVNLRQSDTARCLIGPHNVGATYVSNTQYTCTTVERPDLQGSTASTSTLQLALNGQDFSNALNFGFSDSQSELAELYWFWFWAFFNSVLLVALIYCVYDVCLKGGPILERTKRRVTHEGPDWLLGESIPEIITMMNDAHHRRNLDDQLYACKALSYAMESHEHRGKMINPPTQEQKRLAEIKRKEAIKASNAEHNCCWRCYHSCLRTAHLDDSVEDDLSETPQSKGLTRNLGIDAVLNAMVRCNQIHMVDPQTKQFSARYNPNGPKLIEAACDVIFLAARTADSVKKVFGEHGACVAVQKDALEPYVQNKRVALAALRALHSLIRSCQRNKNRVAKQSGLQKALKSVWAAHCRGLGDERNEFAQQQEMERRNRPLDELLWRDQDDLELAAVNKDKEDGAIPENASDLYLDIQIDKYFSKIQEELRTASKDVDWAGENDEEQVEDAYDALVYDRRASFIRDTKVPSRNASVTPRKGRRFNNSTTPGHKRAASGGSVGESARSSIFSFVRAPTATDNDVEMQRLVPQETKGSDPPPPTEAPSLGGPRRAVRFSVSGPNNIEMVGRNSVASQGSPGAGIQSISSKRGAAATLELPSM